MKTFLSYGLLFFLLITAFTLRAQTGSGDEKPVFVQFMGMVSDETNQVFPGVSIHNLTRKIAVVTGSNGLFTTVAARGDKIEFTYIGYRPQIITVPQDLPDNRYIVSIQLGTDTILLKGPTVTAYPSRDKFKDDMINFKDNNHTDDVTNTSGFHSMDHAPVEKKPSPIMNPISAIGNALQNRKMKNHKGGLDARHQAMMIKDFYQGGVQAVPDSIMRQYK